MWSASTSVAVCGESSTTLSRFTSFRLFMVLLCSNNHLERSRPSRIAGRAEPRGVEQQHGGAHQEDARLFRHVRGPRAVRAAQGHRPVCAYAARAHERRHLVRHTPQAQRARTTNAHICLAQRPSCGGQRLDGGSPLPALSRLPHQEYALLGSPERGGKESPDSDTSTALAEDAAVPPLSQGERRELSEANERLSTICAEASKANLSLLFDAEQTPRSPPPTAANHRSFC